MNKKSIYQKLLRTAATLAGTNMKRRAVTLGVVVMTMIALPTKAVADNVASVTIGESTTNYDSFADAVSAANAAESAATVTLLQDVTTGESSLSLGSAAGVTLDLNGHSIQLEVNTPVIIVPEDKKLTITGSGENSLLYNYYTNVSSNHAVQNYGTLNIEGGTFWNVISSVPVVMNESGATLNVSGGVIGKSNGSQYAIKDNGGTVNISGGTIYYTSTGIESHGALTVSGGTFSGGSIAIDNYGTFAMTAMPVFSADDNCNISLRNQTVIDFTGAVALMAPDTEEGRITVWNGDTFPFVLTKGYAAAFADAASGTAPSPTSVFTVKNASNIELLVGEAIATGSGSEIVALTKAGDGRITNVYAFTSGNSTALDRFGTAITDAIGSYQPAQGETPASIATVVLLKNFSGDDKLTGRRLNIEPSGNEPATVRIDLNGKALEHTNECCFNVFKNATAIITSTVDGASVTCVDGGTSVSFLNHGTLDVSNLSISGAMAITNEGALTVTNCPIRASSTQAIYNTYTSTSCTLTNSPITYTGDYAIWSLVDVELTDWPVIEGNGTDIYLLEEGACLKFDDTVTVPATVSRKFTVDASITGEATKFTEGFAAVANGASVLDYFENTNINRTMSVADDGEGLISGRKISVPAGLSTYCSSLAYVITDSRDDIKLYAVTDVSETSVTLTELSLSIAAPNRRSIAAPDKPFIIYNGTGQPTDILCQWFSAGDYAASVEEYFSMQLGEATLADAFKGTTTELTAYEPANSATLYGFNGEAFVRLDAKPNIAANRCWIEIGDGMTIGGARKLSIVFEGEAATGVKEVREVKEVKADTWYTVDGRKLEKAPSRKGIYIQNGKKLVIK